MDKIPIFKFDIRGQDKVRLLFSYDGLVRPFFWFSMGKDGSIYAGIRKTKSTFAKTGTKSTSDNSIRIQYDEGIPLSSADGPLSSKISMHASGVVHSQGPRVVRPPLRGLKHPTLLSMIILQHPRDFDPVKSVRNRDVITDLRICLFGCGFMQRRLEQWRWGNEGLKWSNRLL
jgi:hypothetical protein